MFWKPLVLSRLLSTESMSLWRPLGAIRDPSLPKLDNLRRAQRAGLAVPEPTLWAVAEELEHQCEKAAFLLDGQIGVPCIVRSVSPTEDTPESSNAGRFQSVAVRHPKALADALQRVAKQLAGKE